MLTVWRSFEQGAGERWLWLQLTVLASSSDALDAFAVPPERLLRTRRADAKVMAEGNVDPPAIAAATDSWAHESVTRSKRGPGIALTLTSVFDR